MKKVLVMLLSAVILAGYVSPASSESTVQIYLPTADNYVSRSQSNTVAGSESLVKISNNGSGKTFITYFAFDLGGKGNDNPKIENLPNTSKGTWFRFDVTASANRSYIKGANLTLMLNDPYPLQANYGQFNSKEAAFNLPHLEVKLSADGKRVARAYLFVFGLYDGTMAEVYEGDSVFDENTLTYDNRYQNATLIGYGEQDAEKSNFEAHEKKNVKIEGLDFSTLAITRFAAFDTAVPNFPKYYDLYDLKRVPSVDKIIEDFYKTTPDGVHPRTISTKSDWEKVRAMVDTHDVIKKWAEAIKVSADACLTKAKPVYKLNDVATLIDTGGAIPPLALMYQMTGDETYARACYLQMEGIAQYQDWNGQNQLNLGTVSYHMGIGYDYLYTWMNNSQRSFIRNNIVNKGLYFMLGRPNVNTNNWNPVVNGGLSIAALAIFEDEPELAAEIIRQSIGILPSALLQYYPDGGFPEGPAYWNYSLKFLADFLSSMNNALGSDYGLSEFPGISDTGYFPLYLQGPTQNIRFLYGDDRFKNIDSPTMFYLSKLYNNPIFGKYQLDFVKNTASYSLLTPYWVTDNLDNFEKTDYSRLPLDKIFRGQNPVGTMRSAWKDPNALFVGFKGGYPQLSHNDMDSGTFTLAALGEEWATELGGGDYVRMGFPSMFRLTRYMYYAMSPQGHNTLIFNPGVNYPSMEYGQALNGYSTIEKSYSSPLSGYNIIDLTSAYKSYASNVKRGIALINDRREFVIQDEISAHSANTTMYWFMHTKKGIDINGNTAILSEGDKRLYCKILSPTNAEFGKMKPEALPNTPSLKGFDMNLNTDVEKIFIKTDHLTNGRVTVWMVPLAPGDEIPAEEPPVLPLGQWPLPEKEAVKLEGITFDGELVEGFAPNKYIYEISMDKKDAEISVQAPKDMTYSIKRMGDRIIITCKGMKTGLSDSRYIISFVKEAKKQEDIKITASSVPEPANPPQSTIDGNLETRWATQGGQWILYELNETKTLDSVYVAFYRGESRKYSFNIELSEDGGNFSKVYEGVNLKSSNGLVAYTFEPQKARFVRINVNGSNENDWSNISEIQFGYAQTEVEDKDLQERDLPKDEE